jgi:CRISPR-associated protein Cas1
MHALAISEQGTRVNLEGETLIVSREGSVLRRVRLGELHQVLLLGQVEITTHALAVLARRGVDVVLLSTQGWFRARLVGPASPQAALRLAQMQRALDPAFCAAVAGAMVLGKVTHQRQILLRAQRRLQDEALADTLGQMRLLLEDCPRAGPDLDRLRGLEGRAAALYFGQLGKLLLRDDLVFQGRTRRPPRDPVNACLSFGYTLLTSVVQTEVLRCGLDPMLGFFHQPLHGRASLALDLVEEFRPFVDTLVLRLLNRRQLSPVDFEQRGHDLVEVLAGLPPEELGPEVAPPPEGPPASEIGVYLTSTGRRIFLGEFFHRLRERLHYPPRQGAFELRDIIREQAYHLARVIEGKDAEYRAFVPA